MEISINRARIGNSIFNNMKLSSFRSRDGMTLDQLSFQNKNLSMNASGKWVNVSGNQITFFDGNFSSSNFGKSRFSKITTTKIPIKKGNLIS